MKYITNNTAITLFISGKVEKVEKTDPRYAKINNCFRLPEAEWEDAILEILNPIQRYRTYLGDSEKFHIDSNTVCYDGERLPKSLADKVLSIVEDGLPLVNFERFWENLKNNPSSQSVEELTQFLEYKELPITEDGCFIAYKGVTDGYWSCNGNPNTKVLQGKVNELHQLYNAPGEVLEVQRRDVDDNRENHCSHGLHVGSLDYAKGFAYKLVVVKVNPADVVSVPSDCSCQKCRVSKYEVLSDYSRELKTSVVNESGVELETNPIDIDLETDYQEADNERSENINKINRYLTNKRAAGVEEVSIRQIQNSFTPGWISKEEVFDALQALGESWYEDEGVTFVSLDW